MEVRELTGAQLDWAVASILQIEDRKITVVRNHEILGLIVEREVEYDSAPNFERFWPTRNWAQGGPILCKATTMTLRDGVYFVEMRDKTGFCLQYTGKSYLEAAMRCFVACQLGPTVNLPTEITFND